jgi:hypothetical protein
MAFFTKTDMQSRGSRHVDRGMAASAALANQTRDQPVKRYDIFLSHRIVDAEIVLGIKAFFELIGRSVYIDWIVDPKLSRQSVSPQTAFILRARMESSTTLIFATTENSSASLWMPWELGFFDGRKGPDRIAVLPILENENDQFLGQEYLGLYPIMEKTATGSLPVIRSISPGLPSRSFSSFLAT